MAQKTGLLLRTRRVACAISWEWVGLLALLLTPAILSGQSVTFTGYSTPGPGPQFIVTGPDGALWFTESVKIGRVTTGGALREWTLPTQGTPVGIAAGPDGALWFTEPYDDRVGRIATDGTITEFGLASGSFPWAITAGPDGALWFTEELTRKVGRITTAGAITAEYALSTTSKRNPWGIVTGSDGALWIAEQPASIARVTTNGQVTEYPVPTPDSYPDGIAAGPDGALWFTEDFGNRIGRITTGGTVTEFPIPTVGKYLPSISTGPDGALWFAEHDSSKIGRITTAGAIIEYPLPIPNSAPNGIALGPDGALWLTEAFAEEIGRAAVNPPIAGNVTVATSPPGLMVTVDGVNYTGTQSFNWVAGQNHSIGVTSPQPGGTGSQYLFAAWSDTGGQTHNIRFTGSTTAYIATLTPQYLLTMSIFPPGSGSVSVSPPSPGGFYNSGVSVQLTATGNLPFQFGNWTGDLSGNASPQTLTMSAPRRVEARFTGPTQSVSFSEYQVPTPKAAPWMITTGPDAALWFTEQGGGKIGRISTAGVISEYAVATQGAPLAITAGPDGALWFTDSPGKIGRITTAGAVTEYPIPTPGKLGLIAAGPDGALWFTESDGNQIGRITTAGAISEYHIPTAGSSPYGITAGPDGALWFVETNGNQVGRITTAGTITEYSVPTAGSSPTDIAAGSDGALWFTESSAQQIGRITTAGAIGEYPVIHGSTTPFLIAAGPDGELWFTQTGYGQIGRITTAGVASIENPPTPGSFPVGITTGPDGAVWFVENQGNNIGREVPPSAVGCTAYSLPQASQAFPGAGGNGAAALRAPAGAPLNCTWTATSDVTWVTITGGARGAGNGTVSYTVAPNLASVPRSGTLTIANQRFTVTQVGNGVVPSCTANVTAAPQVAIEGRTELLGDYLLSCSGLGGVLPADITFTLSTDVTNTLTNGATDAVLTVNGGAPKSGLVAGYNSIRWPGVSLVPASNGTASVRITNVRADASQLLTQRSVANPENPQPAALTGQVSISAAAAVPVIGAVQTLASAVQTLVFTRSPATPGTGPGRTLIPLVFQEAQASSFQATATRVRMALGNVPAGVQIYAPVYPLEGASRAQLYSADNNGLGGAPVAGTALPEGLYQPLNVNAGTVTATWVVLAADATKSESFTFPLLVLASGSTVPSQLTVAASLAPASDVGIASATAPVPRYRDFSAQQKLVNLRVSTSVQGQAAAPFGAEDTVTPGSYVTFATQFVNDTTDPSQTATGVAIRNNLPSSLNPVSCVATAGGTCNQSGNQVQVNYPTVAPGQGGTVTVVAQVNPSFTGSTLEDPATATSDEVNRDLLSATSSISLVFPTGTAAIVSGGPTAGTGVAQSFTFQFSDPSGYQNLGVLNVLFNTSLDGRNACYLAYVVQTGTLYLVDDGGDAGGPYAGSVRLGSANTIQNSQCAVSLASALGSGATLALTLNVSFAPAFGGNKIAYVAAQGLAPGSSNWQVFGVWQVPGAPPAGAIGVTGVTPAAGAAPAGTSQQFQFTLTDSNGTGDFGIVNVLINSAIDGSKSCYLAFSASADTLYLVDDAGDAGGPFAGSMALNGGSRAIENSQCAVSGSGSAAIYSPYTMNLTLNMTFKTAFSGNRVVYVAGRDQTGGNSTGWQAVGIWTVQ